ncbi:MAG: hypothetical protein ACFFDP_05470 [Promethearchaeota archaeon]
MLKRYAAEKGLNLQVSGSAMWDNFSVGRPIEMIRYDFNRSQWIWTKDALPKLIFPSRQVG